MKEFTYDGDKYFSMSPTELTAEKVRLTNNKQKLESNLKRFQLLINDLYHVLELENMSGAKMLQITAKLKKVLKNRRTVKDGIADAEKLIQVVSNIKSMKEKESRDYNFRIAKNFDDLLNSSVEELTSKMKLKELV